MGYDPLFASIIRHLILNVNRFEKKIFGRYFSFEEEQKKTHGSSPGVSYHFLFIISVFRLAFVDVVLDGANP